MHSDSVGSLPTVTAPSLPSPQCATTLGGDSLTEMDTPTGTIPLASARRLTPSAVALAESEATTTQPSASKPSTTLGWMAMPSASHDLPAALTRRPLTAAARAACWDGASDSMPRGR